MLLLNFRLHLPYRR